jgi:hypothetical protein
LLLALRKSLSLSPAFNMRRIADHETVRPYATLMQAFAVYEYADELV